MRKTPYMVSLVGLLVSITLTLISLSLPYWLYADNLDEPQLRYVDYGLYARCERRWVPSEPNGELFREYHCHPFPSKPMCETNGQGFCIAWNTAGYSSQLSLVFAAGALVTITLANITTKKRRRTAWIIVSALIGLHGLFQILTTGLVIHLLHHSSRNFPPSTRYSTSFWIHILSWALDVVIASGLLITGIYARKGHRWAAGRRPYRPIPDHPAPSASMSTA
ncbi:hypothetical protein DL93DRAFT_2089749 [Clavulina sp. PMI_390]|nr:hypothetical protein DL93DRAFT_2089749 [Clavulina sp. PMI_390]